jgi:hypothetical protein
MSAYKGSTGTGMSFSHSCRHDWGPWEVGRKQRWKLCTRCGQVEGEDLDDPERREAGPGASR